MDTLPPQDELRARPEVRRAVRRGRDCAAIAVIVFGSAARGDETARSDLDLLIVAPDEQSARCCVREWAQDWTTDFIPAVMSADSLQKEAETRPSFVLHILREGLLLSSSKKWTQLAAVLETAATDDAALRRELQMRSRALEPLSRHERFVESPITFRSRVYSLARALAISRLLTEDEAEFRWAHVFNRLAALHPDLSDDLAILAALRPYYEYARADDLLLPEVPVGDPEELISAVRQIVR